MDIKSFELPINKVTDGYVKNKTFNLENSNYNFSSILNEVENNISLADKNVYDYSIGKDVPIHQVMISLEQARISVQLLGEVRNKVLDCYNELVRSV